MANKFINNLKIAHLNLNHAKQASLQLAADISNDSIDLCYISEPYYFQQTRITGFTNNIAIGAYNDRPRAAVLIANQ